MNWRVIDAADARGSVGEVGYMGNKGPSTTLGYHGWKGTRGKNMTSWSHPDHPGHEIEVHDVGGWQHANLHTRTHVASGGGHSVVGGGANSLHEHLQKFHGKTTDSVDPKLVKAGFKQSPSGLYGAAAQYHKDLATRKGFENPKEAHKWSERMRRKIARYTQAPKPYQDFRKPLRQRPGYEGDAATDAKGIIAEGKWITDPEKVKRIQAWRNRSRELMRKLRSKGEAYEQTHPSKDEAADSNLGGPGSGQHSIGAKMGDVTPLQLKRRLEEQQNLILGRRR